MVMVAGVRVFVVPQGNTTSQGEVEGNRGPRAGERSLPKV